MLFLEKNFCYEWMLVTQSCTTLCDPIDCSPPGSCPWDFPGKDTGMGYHCLLQGSYEWNYCLYNDNHWYYIMQNEESDHLLLPVVKVKVLVAQSWPTLWDPMDYSPSGLLISTITAEVGLQTHRSELVYRHSHMKFLQHHGADPGTQTQHSWILIAQWEPRAFMSQTEQEISRLHVHMGLMSMQDTPFPKGT